MYNLQEQEPQRTNRANDEIDLRTVFNKLGSFARGIRNYFAYLFHVIKSRFLLLLFCTLIGAGIGYLLYYTTKPYYTSSMTLVLAQMRNEFLEDQLIKLSIMIDDNNFETIADRLDISEEQAKGIKGMTFYNLDQERIAEDSILIGSPFKVELSLYNSALFPVMEVALVDYLQSNRFFAKQRRIRQTQIQNMIGKLKSEVNSIDSVKTNVTDPRGPVNGFVYGEPIDPVNLYRESVSLYQQQINLEAELEQLNTIEVVTGFSPRNRATGPRLKRYLAIGGLIAFMIGLVIVVNIDGKAKKR